MNRGGGAVEVGRHGAGGVTGWGHRAVRRERDTWDVHVSIQVASQLVRDACVMPKTRKPQTEQ